MGSKQFDKQALQGFLNALTEPAFLLDRLFLIRAANQAFANRLHVDLSTLIGEPAFNFISAEAAAARRPHVERVFQTGRSESFEDSRQGRFFVNHINPVLGEGDEVEAVAVFALDITETKRAQASIQASEHRYQQIITTCQEGVWQIDADSMTCFVNPQMTMIFGYSIDEFLGRSMFDFMDEEAQKVASANVERRRDGIAERHEFRFRHKTGRDVWTSLATNPIFTPSGDYAGAVALVTDISDNRLLEARMQQTQKLESLGLLAGGIAHDFNNLLVGILANVGIAQRVLAPQSPGMGPLREIQRAADAAARLTSELLAYSGSGRFVTEPLHLENIVTEVSKLLDKVISKQTRIDVDLAPNVPAIEADVGQLRQVVMNLFTNASEALGDMPGAIEASVFVAQLTPEEVANVQIDNQLSPGKYVCLQVVDSGAGMDDETQSRMFEPFFSTKFTGRGLGLAAVQGILRGHQAGLLIDSTVGRGTTIRVYFPIAASQPAKTPALTNQAADLRTGSGLVLVVDDEEMVREAAVNILEMSGFEVLSCGNGHDALPLIDIQGEALRAVLLDHTMPGLSGTQVLNKLREKHPQLPVVMTSGYTDQGIILENSGLPATFLKKPFDIDRLLDAMFAALGQSVTADRD